MLGADGPIHKVTNRNDSCHASAFKHGQMAHAMVGHQPHAIFHGMKRRCRNVIRRNDLAHAGFSPDSPFDARLRDAFLAAIYRSGANLVLLPIQDIFGWRDRINVPGTVGSGNWTWRLPFSAGDLLTRPDAAERATFLQQLARETGRNAS